MSSSDDDDNLARTMTSERSDADFMECFGDTSLRDHRGQPRDPFAPSNDDDYFFDNHSVVDGEYVSKLVAPPEDEFPLGSRVFIVADLRELKRTMGPYFFEEKMFRLLGGARRITGKVLRHHGDYTVVEFVVPLEDMFSGTYARRLGGGGGGYRRQSLQHRQSITLAPDGTTLYPNVSSSAGGGSCSKPRRRESLTVLESTCAPGGSGALLDSTQRPSDNQTPFHGAPTHEAEQQDKAQSVPPLGIKKLSLAGLSGGGTFDRLSARPMRSARNRSNMASPRTPRGGAALLSPRTAASQSEKIAVAYTFHRSVIELSDV